MLLQLMLDAEGNLPNGALLGQRPRARLRIQDDERDDDGIVAVPQGLPEEGRDEAVGIRESLAMPRAGGRRCGKRVSSHAASCPLMPDRR